MDEAHTCSSCPQCDVSELQGNALECIMYLNEEEASRALDEFRDSDPRKIRNKGVCGTDPACHTRFCRGPLRNSLRRRPEHKQAWRMRRSTVC